MILTRSNGGRCSSLWLFCSLALILVLVKDREFWFPPTPATAAESEPAEPTETDTQTKDQAQASYSRPPAQPSHHRPDAQIQTSHPPPAVVTPSPAPALAPVVTSRTVLPPLEVEVVAGDEHRTIQAGTNSVKVDLQPRTPSLNADPTQEKLPTPPARVHVSAGAAQICHARLNRTIPCWPSR